MRSAKTPAMLAVIVSAAVSLAALPASAQPAEEFPGPSGSELQGYTRSDGTVVLTDASFCTLLLGSIWGDERLTFVDLLDKTKKQKKARAGAIQPGTDEATVSRCAEIIGAYREAPSDDDTLVAWASRSPVVPEALASLLPDDFVADPLAQPAAVLEASRTTGFGSLVSAPFLMDDETWLVQVDAADCATWSGSLHNARDAEQVIAVDDNREYLYNVEPGHYYWDVTAPDCDWSVDLAAIPIGPDPNATPVPRVPVPLLHGEGWSRLVDGDNSAFLTAAQARQAILDAGLTVGECTEAGTEFVTPDRVWAQDPPAGTLLELGSPVNVTIGTDCDVLVGDRIILE